MPVPHTHAHLDDAESTPWWLMPFVLAAFAVQLSSRQRNLFPSFSRLVRASVHPLAFLSLSTTLCVAIGVAIFVHGAKGHCGMLIHCQHILLIAACGAATAASPLTHKDAFRDALPMGAIGLGGGGFVGSLVRAYGIRGSLSLLSALLLAVYSYRLVYWIVAGAMHDGCINLFAPIKYTYNRIDMHKHHRGLVNLIGSMNLSASSEERGASARLRGSSGRKALQGAQTWVDQVKTVPNEYFATVIKVSSPAILQQVFRNII